MGNWNPKANDIFLEAVEQTDLELREAFLVEACGLDDELRKQVDSLLKSDAEAPSLLDGRAAQLTIGFEEEEYVGAQIGPYKIREKLGEGGMGVVYVAEQVKPIRRKVALKIVKPGMDTRQVLARFDAERQSLAMMDHPHVAKVLDAGATPLGRSYFVMELIQGLTITEYCDKHKLTTPERLEILVKVCKAVHHAHQKGIIHRDLKPSNVLVADIDGVAMPKVIDFGVAKATGQKLTEESVYTHFSQMVGTPMYMSPEQVGMGVIDVDTRSDVYSLGVLTYELLTGCTPFDREAVKRASIAELQRMIREDEPARPSARVSTLKAKDISTVSQRRGSEPRRLSSLLQGELDWIVMKSLEKDRNRRYESANAFAADISRYLNDEPVYACPPTRFYRLSKFARRNKTVIGVAGLIATSLVTATAISTWQARVAFLAKEEAINSRTVAERANSETKAAMDFLTVDMVGGIAPDVAGDPDVSLRDALDRGALRVQEAFNEMPLSEATVQYFIGRSYRLIGEYDKAVKHSQRATDLRNRHLGAEHTTTLEARHELALAHKENGNLDVAIGLASEVFDARLRVLGPRHVDSLESMLLLANSCSSNGDVERAEKLLNELLPLSQQVCGLEEALTLKVMNAVGVLYGRQRKLQQAREQFSRLLEIRQRTLGPKSLDTIATMNNLSIVLLLLGEDAEARELMEESIEVNSMVRGPEHPATLGAIVRLSELLLRLGNLEEARTRTEEVRDIQRRTLGAEHPDTLITQNTLGRILTDLGSDSEATSCFQDGLRISLESLGPAHPVTLTLQVNLSECLGVAGQVDEACTMLQDVIGNGRDLPIAASAHQILAELLASQPNATPADLDRALELATEATRMAPEEGKCWAGVGHVHYRRGDWTNAIEALKQSLEIPGSEQERARLLLSMAESRLGNEREAQRWYDLAVESITQLGNNRTDVAQLRAEAEKLLDPGVFGNAPNKP